ncbi:MAG: VOC family protein [Dehalococcoidia bacterium]|jgi:uncharacterized glyoxalase superfamily protein PhnB|nr:VOC family protein [Dehalococcoidia bacterium]
MTSEDGRLGRVVLDQVNLVVGNMAASVDFYRLLGVNIPATKPGWSEHHRTAVAESETSGKIDFDLDSQPFAAYWGAESDKVVATGPVLGFRVATREAVDRVYERVTAAGHVGRRAPYDAFWGARYAIVEDSDGTAVGVMSPPEAEHRAPPSPPDFAS